MGQLFPLLRNYAHTVLPRTTTFGKVAMWGVAYFYWVTNARPQPKGADPSVPEIFGTPI